MRPVSEAAARIASKSFSRKYIALGRILDQWQEIIGEDLSSCAVPVKINYRKGKDGKAALASLDIAVSSANATALHYRKGLILERINRTFGENWITDIRFVAMTQDQMNSPTPREIPKPLQAGEKKYLAQVLEDIEDIEIKERLENLGKAILTKAKT